MELYCGAAMDSRRDGGVLGVTISWGTFMLGDEISIWGNSAVSSSAEHAPTAPSSSSRSTDNSSRKKALSLEDNRTTAAPCVSATASVSWSFSKLSKLPSLSTACAPDLFGSKALRKATRKSSVIFAIATELSEATGRKSNAAGSGETLVDARELDAIRGVDAPSEITGLIRLGKVVEFKDDRKDAVDASLHRLLFGRTPVCSGVSWPVCCMIFTSCHISETIFRKLTGTITEFGEQRCSWLANNVRDDT